MKRLLPLLLLSGSMLLTSCAPTSVKPSWLEKVPDTVITDTARDVLEKNKGNILTPEMLNNLQVLDKEPGWAFRMSYVQKTYDETLDPVYVLTSIKGHEYYFESISPFLSGAISRYKWLDGRKFKQSFGKYHYRNGYEEHCKFKLGPCSYDGYVTHAEVYTEYNQGIWTRKLKVSGNGFLTDYATIREIYDASGLPLYKYKWVHTDLAKRGATEYVRKEYNYSSMADPELMKAILKGAQIRNDRDSVIRKGIRRAQLLERAKKYQQKHKDHD